MDNSYKMMFDLFISVVLIFICGILPFRIAFFPKETETWKTIYTIADSFFLIDLILNFMTTHFNEEKNLEITDRKYIAYNYLTGWFLIDFFSIVPFEQIMPLFLNTGSGDGGGSNNIKMTMLIRIPRIAKIYKLVKLFRMIKVIKLVKNKERIKSQMGKSLQINSAMERLIMFSFIIGYCEHIFACFWCIIGTEEAALLKNAWQNDGISNLGIHEQYIISLYFVTTTMTTVGYGDMSGKTGVEQVYLIIMMMSGGFIFSMLTGSLSSIL